MSTNPRIPYRLFTDRPKLPGPDGKTYIIHAVVNVENWRFDAAMPRKILTAPHGFEALPDVPNFAWAEYGMRCGMPRLLDAFGRRGLPASTPINAGVIETYPRLAGAMKEAGWEFIGHGLDQKSVQAETGTGEADAINRAIEILSAFTGRPVRGWLSPGLRETAETPDHLRKAGIDYCMDWVLDDQPVWMRTEHGPMIAMPYTLEINDSVLHAVEAHASDEMLRRLELTLRAFDREGDGGARIVSLGLHPHLIAVPHRIGTLEAILDLLTARDDVVFMTGGQIADWYSSVEPEPAAT